ncbi:MAG: hydroxymyristoyl-ACP dehydratase [Lachnospiraceae bacterium]|jgi:hypothetical protein|nr:hydroxymyristoyl-ACP dehydratase [Lachnospiraceae bacterium]
MTNINCSSSCIYQKEGKCTLDDVYADNKTITSDCAYFTKK